MRVLEVFVDPQEIGVAPLHVAREVLVGQLARGQHHLPVLAVDDVAVVVHVDEAVVGPDLLELGEGQEQRRVVPEPDVPEGRAVPDEVGRRQGLAGREVALLDPVERERPPRELDVVGDERALRDQGVRRDAEALHESRECPEPADPPDGQHDEAGHDRPGAAAEDVHESRERAQASEDGQPAEGRQGRVHVGVGRAEHGAPLRVQEVVPVEPEIDRLREEQKREQDEEVDAGAGGDHRTARGQHQDAPQEVDQRRQDQGQHEHGEDPAQPAPPQRELEHVEGHVALEDRVGHAERLGVPVQEHILPLRAGGQPHQEGHDGDDWADQPMEQRLQHHAAGETERLLELPEHIGGAGTDGGPQVRGKEQEGHEPDADEDGAARRCDAEEDGQVPNLLEPEPVHIEGHGLEGQDHGHADADQDRGPPAHGPSSSTS